MITNNDIITCLPLLASVLGNRYGVKVQMGGNKAFTDGKMIQLPALPANCDQQTMAIAKGYLDHEAAHIRHTDFELVNEQHLDKITHFLFNAIEDWRVENKLSEIYPGCRINLNRIIKKFFVDERSERIGNKNPILSALSYVLLTVRSWNVNEVLPVVAEVRSSIESAYPELLKAIDKIMAQIQLKCSSTNDSLNYAYDLASLIKLTVSNKDKTAQSSVEEPKKADDSASKKIGNIKRENNNVDKIDERTSQSGPTKCGSSATNSAEISHDSREISAEFWDNINSDDLPKNIGEILMSKLELPAEEATPKGVELPRIENVEIEQLSQDELKEALLNSNALRNRLESLLESRLRRRIFPARKGDIYTNNLYRVSVGNPKIFLGQSESKGMDTAIYILLDKSGSMNGQRMALARQTCFALAKSLVNIKGLKLAISAFSGRYYPASIIPLLGFGQKLSTAFGLKACGGTPLEAALWYALQELALRDENIKIIFIITDGVPNPSDQCEKPLEILNKLGIEVYGLGILCDFIQRLLPKNSRVIYKLEELTPAMFGILQDALLKREVK